MTQPKSTSPHLRRIAIALLALLSLLPCGAEEQAKTNTALPFSFTVSSRPLNLDVLSLYIDSPLRQVVMDGGVWVMGTQSDPYHNPVSVPRWKGPDFEHMTRQPDGFADFSQRTASSFIDSGLWYDEAGKTLYALMHGEYEHDVPGGAWCRKKTWLAMSPDLGLHWKFVGDVVTSVLPNLGDRFNYSGSDFEMGPADYDLYVDKRGGYFYATFWNGYVAKHGLLNKFAASREEVARCAISDKMAPGKWFKFRDGAWTEPGLGGKASEVAMKSYGIYGNTIYSTYLKRYVRVGVNVGVGDPRFPNVGLRDDSIYISTCTDLAKQDWTAMAKLLNEPGNTLDGFTLAGDDKIDPTTCGQTLHVYNYWEKRGRILDVTFGPGTTAAAPLPEFGSYSYEPHPESGDPIESRQTKITGCASPDMHYSGDGWSEESNPLYYRGKIKRCSSPGNSVEFSFRGSDIYWRAIAGPDGGKADIYIDGQLQNTVDLYFADTPPIFQFAYIKTGLDAGTSHTIKVVSRGDKNEKSSGTMINHMAFEFATESYWASAGFSGIFGKNNWSYWSHHNGDWELNFDPASDRWSNPLNCVVGNNYQAPAINCDADRKWVAPHDGAVRIEGTASIDGTDAAGFTASILKSADTLWSAKLTSPNKPASSHDQQVTVHTGDSISFVVHKEDPEKGQPASGASNAKVIWDPVITYTAP